MMSIKLVLLGGGHAHMTALARLEEFVDICESVTVVQPSPYHYYSGMGAGLLGGTYQPEELRFDTQRRVKGSGARFICDRATAIDPVGQTVSLKGGGQLKYDLLSCNVGSSVTVHQLYGRSTGANEDTVFPVKPIEGLVEARRKICSDLKKGRVRVAIVGGGPSAIEIAGNLIQLQSETDGEDVCVDLFCGSTFMAYTPPRLQALAKDALRDRGVNIYQGNYVASIEGSSLVLDDGTIRHADVVFVASGVTPSPLFGNSGIATGGDGGLLVNCFLQSVQYANIFGGGDCISYQPRPLDKVGVYAVRQNDVLHHNLTAFIRGEGLRPFEPGGDYLLIYNLGNGEGILSKWKLSMRGKLPFMLKDFIDRRFMKKFQISEKPELI